MKFSNRFCTDADRRLGSLDEIRHHPFFIGVDWDHIRDRPAAYQPRVKSIDDTSNFDDFPDVDLKLRMCIAFLLIDQILFDIFQHHQQKIAKFKFMIGYSSIILTNVSMV